MSTLTIPTQRHDDTDARFAVLVGSAPAQHGQQHVDFETVFDLDYGQPAEPAPVRASRPVRAVKPVKVKPARPVPQRVALTRRGRLVLVLTFLAAALALMVPLGGWATATLTGGSPEPVRVVEVQPGDTLYGIAADLAEPGQIREMVHRIQQLNSLPGGQIAEGQKLAVPRG